ncbi:ferredoxin [Micromonospora haikouensis]|uniref:ferredoxin n=1 Tax=Micromonospora haikouensis TaxID=686309 RepID=UPI003D744021
MSDRSDPHPFGGDGQVPARLSVDAQICIGSGECVLAEPDVFAFEADQTARVLPGPALHRMPTARARELAMNCPSSAISVGRAPDGEVE